MIQINIGDHVSTEPGFTAVPGFYLGNLRWARQRAIWIAANLPGADRYFVTLPRRRTLTDILADRTIWLNYYCNIEEWGAVERRGWKEVGIATKAFREGRWVVPATLIHEMAHVGGAGVIGHAAEQAVLACGLGRRRELLKNRDDPTTPYNPAIVG